MGKPLQPELYSQYCNRLVSAHKDRFFDRISLLARDANRDRFGILNDLSVFRVVSESDPLPADRIDHSILEELCLQRAIEIDKISPNGIAISQSGGVDSSSVISAFLLAGVSAEKLIVLYTKDSLKEAPNLFASFKNLGVRFVEKPINEFISIYDTIDVDSIVFGQGADHLYHFFRLYQDRKSALEPQRDQLKKFYQERDCLYWLDCDIYALQRYSESLSQQINSFFELCVMINTGCRFSGLRDFFKNQCVNKITREKVKIFFDAPYFTNWGYMNRDKTAQYFQRENNVDYKPELKNLIQHVTKDSDYRIRKGKEGSQSKQYCPIERNKTLLLGVHDSEGYHHYSWDNVVYKSTSHRTLVELYDSVMDRYLRYDKVQN